jgi:hypothetical protein
MPVSVILADRRSLHVQLWPRRQERLCRAQRPGAKIDAIATSAGDRDRTSRI